MKKFRILVLGGYGNFGKRICSSLGNDETLSLVVAGRNLNKAQRYCEILCEQFKHLDATPAAVDITHPELTSSLRALKPNLVIHTSGPFQGQSYNVVKACIELGAHYIDLADDRRYVCDITQFNQQAKAKGLLLVSGASSVPGLSSTVIDHFAAQLAKIDTINYAIAPGNNLQRGYATIKAILSYTGHAFTTWKNGRWVNIYGWMNSKKIDLGEPIGQRRVANIDVPDLELFPKRYHPVKNISFQAGLELGILHNTMVVMAWLVKKRFIKNWAPFTGLALTSSNWLYSFGTDLGGMVIKLKGLDNNGETKQISWTLIAENGVGPYIPTLPAIIIAKKLLHNEINTRGAQPCLGLFSLDEFMALAQNWGIYQRVESLH